MANESNKKSFMIMKKLYKDGNKQVYMLSYKNGYVKAKISIRAKLEPGQVIEINNYNNQNFIDVEEYHLLKDFKSEDYLPSVDRHIEEIMDDIEQITNECVTSIEGKKLNDYFFKDEKFLEEFKKGIGGISMHHNYIGGLAEHTLGVMELTKYLCDKYDCPRREIAVLSAKLHDIGKLKELDFNGPFKYTLQGELEGHIVIGVQMIDRAIRDMNVPFSEDFIRRIKGCITQHHGKLEYGSPRATNMEESFIVNFADSVDATMNKINQIRHSSDSSGWSEYDRKLETKLYL